MLRETAGQVLGIRPGASRTEARRAYMGLLQRAASELGSASPEFEFRRTQLHDAYSAFSEEPAYKAVSPPLQHPLNPYGSVISSTDGRNRMRNFVLIGAGILAGIFVVGSLIDSNGSTSNVAKSSSSSTPTSAPSQATTPRPSTTPNTGRSGLLNSCWRDDTSINAQSNNGLTPVLQVDCNNPQSQWKVYREVKVESQCPDLSLMMNDGWVLCIRPL